MTTPADSAPVETSTEHAPTPEERSAACSAELVEVLRRHNCRLVARILDPEPVGHMGSGVIVRAESVVVPL